VSQLDGSTEPFAAQGATANPAERPPLDRFSSASTSLNLARRLVLSLLAPDAQDEAAGVAAGSAPGALHQKPCCFMMVLLPAMATHSTGAMMPACSCLGV